MGLLVHCSAVCLQRTIRSLARPASPPLPNSPSTTSLLQLSRSMVVGDKGEEKVDPVRTSYSSGLGIGQDEVVRRIEKRIAEWTHLPVNHGEPIEVCAGVTQCACADTSLLPVVTTP